MMKPARKVLLITFLLGSLQALAAMAFILLQPSDARNSALLGYSWERLLLAGVLLLLAVGLAIPPHLMFHQAEKSEDFIRRFFNGKSRTFATSFLAILFLAGWLGSFTSPELVGARAAYFVRLKPAVIWLTLFSGELLASLLVLHNRLNWKAFQEQASGEHRLLKTAAISAVSMTAGGVLVAATGLGINPDVMQWNTPGVPLLGFQVFAACLLGVALMLLFGWLERSWRIIINRFYWWDGVILVTLWVLAFFSWQAAPQHSDFFAPGPYPPEFEYYPFSDAAKYDLSAQYAIIGRGYDNNTYTDKPLYSALLTFFHLLGGADFQQVLPLQAALLAFIPVVLYLCGKRLHSRTSGLIAGGLFVVHQINSIQAGAYFQVSHVRLLLSDLPMALFLALFTWAMIAGLQKPGKTESLLAAGGLLGLSTLIRHNAWFLLLAAGGLILVMTWKNKRIMIVRGMLFLLVFFASIIPWMIQSTLQVGTPFYFLGTLQNVIWKNRYQPSLFPTPTPPALSPGAVLDEAPNDGKLAAPVPYAAPGSYPSQNDRGLEPSWEKISSIARFVTSHFTHNLIATIWQLPTSVMFMDIKGVVNNEPNYWSADWIGELPGEGAGMLILQLGILALGIGAAVQYGRGAGLIPLVVLIFYLLSAAIARTSGGRYIVPVQWVVLLYYAMGWVQLLQWAALLLYMKPARPGLVVENPGDSFRPGSAWKNILTAIFFLGAGAFIPGLENLIPERYPEQSRAEILAYLSDRGILEQQGYSREEFQAFLEQSNVLVLRGRVLYPRYYYTNQGEPDIWSPLRPLGYRRLTFAAIGSGKSGTYVLPMEKAPESFPHGSDAIVIGCKSTVKLDAFMVVLNGENDRVYERSPRAPLSCPLREPVCDSNHVCR